MQPHGTQHSGLHRDRALPITSLSFEGWWRAGRDSRGAQLPENDATVVLVRAELPSALESLSVSPEVPLELYRDLTSLGARRGGGCTAAYDKATVSRSRVRSDFDGVFQRGGD